MSPIKPSFKPLKLHLIVVAVNIVFATAAQQLVSTHQQHGTSSPPQEK